MKNLEYIIILFLIEFLCSIHLFSQDISDSVVKIDTLKTINFPKKAAILSAIIPGWGQVFNKKYWKVPIIYTSLVACGYFVNENREKYLIYKRAYIAETDNDTNTINELSSFRYTVEGIKARRDQFKKWMQLSYIIGGLTYIVNIIDAYVDAQLFDFDVSDQFSVHWQPNVITFLKNNTTFTGLSIYINF